MNGYQWQEYKRRQKQVLVDVAESVMFGRQAGTDAGWAYLESRDGEEAEAAGAGPRTRDAAAAGCDVHDRLRVEGASPAGNTGDKVTVCLDWLNVTGPVSSLKRVRKLVEVLVGRMEDRDRGLQSMRGTTRSCVSESTAMMAWAPEKSTMLVSLNGSSLSIIPVFKLMRLIVRLHRLGFRSSRLDSAVDLPLSMMSMEQVHAAADAGHYRGFRSDDIRRPKHRDSKKLKGDSRTFGSHENGKMVCVYNKELESHGRIRAIRVESRVHAEFALAAWHELVQVCKRKDMQGFATLLGRIVGGQIDFADGSCAHRHGDRYRRFEWWQKVLDVIGSMKLQFHHHVPPLQKSLIYLRDAFAGKLAAAQMFLDSVGIEGREFMHFLVDVMVDRGMKKLEAVGARLPSFVGFDPAAVLGRAPPDALPI